MRNLIIVGVLVFFIVLLGGGAIVWFFQAHALKSSIENSLSEINNGDSYITYSAIETSGFPNRIDVSLVNPRFTGGVDTFLVRTFAHDISKGASPFRELTAWSEDIALEGRIVISVNALSNEYSMRVIGNWKDSSTITGQSTFLVGRSSSESSCVLNGKRNSILAGAWSLKNITTGDNEFFNNIRSVDCNIPAGSIAMLKDDGGPNEEEPLFSNGPQRLYLTQDIAGDQRTLHLSAQSTDLQMTSQADNYLYQYMLILIGEDVLPPRMNMSGKQSSEFDATLTLPVHMEDPLNTPMKLNIAHAHSDSNIETNDLYLDYELQPTTENISLKLIARAQTAFKNGYDDLVNSKAHDLFHKYFTTNAPEAANIRTALQRFPNESDLHHIVNYAIPKFEPLKQASLNIDALYKGDREMSNGLLTFNDFQAGFLPYGINAVGTLRRSPEVYPMPDITLTCRACVYLVNDLADFANRVQQTYAKLSPEDAKPFLIRPARVESLKSFLKALAGKADSGPEADLSFHVFGDGTNNLTINDKNMAELHQLYDQYFPADSL